MSTILDALRKSEKERKLNKLPTLTDMVAPQEPPRWPLYVGLALVLLAIALVVLAYVIWSAKPEVTAQITADVAIGQTVAQTETVQPTSVDEKSVAQTIDSNSGEDRPLKDPMLVNVVSYSKDPAYSFAVVNGKMVREGDFIEPGLKLEEILPDALVFNSRGKKITRSP